MMFGLLAALLLASAHSVAPRAEQKLEAAAPLLASGPSNVTHTSLVTMAEGVIEYELHDVGKEVLTVDKVLFAIFVGVFPLIPVVGFAGLDRCILGSFFSGTLKCLTCGGCGCWAFVDFVIIAYNFLSQASTINIFGMKANFSGDVVIASYVFVAVCLISCVASKYSAPRFAANGMAMANRTTGYVGRYAPDTLIRMNFDRFDTNNSGYLDRDEMAAFLDHIGMKSHDSLISKCDKDGNGKIYFDEFLAAFKEHTLDASKLEA
eukprot:TRINITY_DN40968_c0_g1_i1.p1 TRINITY_DN40968_c0_g1~~TRINITY_DN40968_c0_g1_i1.p1  ORF type:complete len:263 (-),score=36.09 TRINITY_DN40968_c0_g1_i1:30-818(-)